MCACDLAVLDEILGGSEDEEADDGQSGPVSAVSAKGRRDVCLSDHAGGARPGSGLDAGVIADQLAGRHDSTQSTGNESWPQDRGRDGDRQIGWREPQWDRDRSHNQEWERERSGRERDRARENNWDNPRAGFDNRDNPDNTLGGFDDSRGGFDNSRAGFDNQRGGFENSRGGFDNSRGGFDNSRGGFDNSRGGFEGPNPVRQDGGERTKEKPEPIK